MFALTFEAARDSGLAIVAGAVVIAVVAGVADQDDRRQAAHRRRARRSSPLVVWTQRVDVGECADRVGATLAAGAVDDTTCTFFGQDVTVSSPLG